MKVWVVRNKSVPAEILAMLSCDSDPGIRAAVASKNKLPRELMDLLASDLDESVRHRIVFNKNASAGVLEKLSTDSSSMVAESARAKLASRPQSS